MSKELETLESIKNLILPVLEDDDWRITRHLFEDYLDIIENALKRLENYEKNEDFSKDVINYAFLSEKDKIKKLRALEIVKESIGLKMSVDEDIGCLYVPITKCFQPLEQNICIVGYVKGKDKIDLLKEVLL